MISVVGVVRVNIVKNRIMVVTFIVKNKLFKTPNIKNIRNIKINIVFKLFITSIYILLGILAINMAISNNNIGTINIISEEIRMSKMSNTRLVVLEIGFIWWIFEFSLQYLPTHISFNMPIHILY